MDFQRCRLCGQESFELKVLTSETQKKISRLMPVVVFIGDMLPQEICVNCERRLDEHSAFCEEAKRAERYFLSRLPMATDENKRTSLNAMVKFHDFHGEIMTVAYKAFMNIDQPEPLANFIKNTISDTTLFTCKVCRSIYLSQKAALMHVCLSKTSTTTNYSSPLRNVENEQPRRKHTEPASAVAAETAERQTHERSEMPHEPETLVPLCLGFKTPNPSKDKRRKRKRKHRKISSPTDDANRNNCHVCGLWFQNEYELNIHFDRHFSGHQDVRHMSFERPKALDGFSVRRYVCEICHHTFTRKSSLLTHHDQTHKTRSEDNYPWSDDDDAS